MPQTLLPIPPRSATQVVVPEQPGDKPAGSSNTSTQPATNGSDDKNNTTPSTGTAR